MIYLLKTLYNYLSIISLFLVRFIFNYATK